MTSDISEGAAPNVGCSGAWHRESGVGEASDPTKGGHAHFFVLADQLDG